MTLSITTLCHYDKRHCKFQNAECRYAECHYADCRGALFRAALNKLT
jgi:hypothetical protein